MLKPQRIIPLLAVLMLVFAIPKLAGMKVSVLLFARINDWMGWQGSWFRYLTGLVELETGLLLLAGLLRGQLWSRLYLLGLLQLAGTMCGALVVELWLRPGEDWALTLLAAFLLACAIILLSQKLKKTYV